MTDLPINLTLHPDFGDPECHLNIRKWLESAVTTKGARVTGGGMGMGVADLDVEIEGMPYVITIRPIMKGMQNET